MAESPEEIHKSIKKILWVGGLLTFFTAATVGLSYVELPTHSLNIIVGMILATIKAALVALIFMHLNHEKKAVYWLFASGLCMVCSLAGLTALAMGDPIFDKFFYSGH